MLLAQCIQTPCLHGIVFLSAGLFHVNYFGGDIILTPEQKAMIIEGSQQSSADVRRAVQRTQSVLWRDGKVPYVLDRTLSKSW